jgi:hypothetical protein
VSLPETLRVALFWMAAAAFAVAQVGLLVVTLRPAAPGAEPRLPGRFGRGAELAMLLLPAVGLALLLLLSWPAIRVSSP